MKPLFDIVAAKMEGQDCHDRRAVVEALRDLLGAVEPFVDAVATTLSDTDSSVGKAASEALERIGLVSKLVLLELVALLHDSDQDIRKMAGKVWEELRPAFVNDSSCARELAALLEDRRFGGKVAPRALNNLLDVFEENPATAQALSLPVGKKGGAPLVSTMDSMRGLGIALGRIGLAAKPFLEMLAHSLADKDAKVRSEAASVFGRLGSWLGGVPGAGPLEMALAANLEDKDIEIREGVAKARENLRALRIMPEPLIFVAELAERLNDKSHIVRKAAAEALGELGRAAKPYQVVLSTLLQDNDADVRRAATTALRQI